MSSDDQQQTFQLAWELAQLADGAIVGIGMACLAVHNLIKCIHASSALTKLRNAHCVPVSGLRSLLHRQNDSSSGDGEVLVFVRGTVDKFAAKTVLEKGWFKSVVERGRIKWAAEPKLPSDVLFSSKSGEKCVILQNIQSVPFVLKEGGQQSQSDHLVVNMKGSKHPLPLVTVDHKRHPIRATSVRTLFAQDNTVDLLKEEKILPIGKEITAVGVCSLKDGVPEINSKMGKDEMIADLSFGTKKLMWSSILIGSISVGILGYAIARNLVRRKERQQQARVEAGEAEVLVEDREEKVPEWKLCVVCLTRRRVMAFVPCGHLLCCKMCAPLIERRAKPKCPVCRQSICSSVRIYAS